MCRGPDTGLPRTRASCVRAHEEGAIGEENVSNPPPCLIALLHPGQGIYADDEGQMRLYSNDDTWADCSPQIIAGWNSRRTGLQHWLLAGASVLASKDGACSL